MFLRELSKSSRIFEKLLVVTKNGRSLAMATGRWKEKYEKSLPLTIYINLHKFTAIFISQVVRVQKWREKKRRHILVDLRVFDILVDLRWRRSRPPAQGWLVGGALARQKKGHCSRLANILFVLLCVHNFWISYGICRSRVRPSPPAPK